MSRGTGHTATAARTRSISALSRRKVLHESNVAYILHEIRKRKANWIGHILRRNCFLQQVIEWKIKRQIEVTRRRGRRRKKLLEDLRDLRGYCQLKEEALDRTMWRKRFGIGFGPVVWQITDDDDECSLHACLSMKRLGCVSALTENLRCLPSML